MQFENFIAHGCNTIQHQEDYSTDLYQEYYPAGDLLIEFNREVCLWDGLSKSDLVKIAQQDIEAYPTDYDPSEHSEVRRSILTRKAGTSPHEAKGMTYLLDIFQNAASINIYPISNLLRTIIFSY